MGPGFSYPLFFFFFFLSPKKDRGGRGGGGGARGRRARRRARRTPAVLVMGFLVPELGLLKAIGLTTALIVSPFALAIPLLRRRRQALEREMDALDALMRQP